MLKPKRPTVEIGNRFHKASDPLGKVWEVVTVWQAVDGILHARLRSCDRQGSLITIAAGVLLDPIFWRPAARE